MSRFSVVDVFSAEPLRGNPVAVWHDAAGVCDETMAAFARWTNLSETTFLLPPTDPCADYYLRIFTPGGELPFAGHPTLGSARAWLAAGGVPRGPEIVQECGAGLIRVRVDDDFLAFAAPVPVRDEALSPATIARAARGCGLSIADVVAGRLIVNGPLWTCLLVRNAATVLRAVPDPDMLADLEVGLMGPYAPGGPADFEVRAFCPDLGMIEDPVTGSLNAAFAQWLGSEGRVPASYTVTQGVAVHRAGRLTITTDDVGTWVGGTAVVRVTGELHL